MTSVVVGLGWIIVALAVWVALMILVSGAIIAFRELAEMLYDLFPHEKPQAFKVYGWPHKGSASRRQRGR